MTFAIRPRRPPLNGTFGYPFFYPLFLLQLNLTFMKRILHLVSVKNITLVAGTCSETHEMYHGRFFFEIV